MIFIISPYPKKTESEKAKPVHAICLPLLSAKMMKGSSQWSGIELGGFCVAKISIF